MILEEALIYSCTMGCAGSFAKTIYPAIDWCSQRLSERMGRYEQARAEGAAKALDDLFIEVKPTAWLRGVYLLAPIAAGLAAFALSNNMLPALFAVGLGLVLPDLVVRQARKARLRKFRGQLLDALFILSSSLRAGLSITQAFEQIESEMTPPASQEFGLMMKATRMGRSFEEAVGGLNTRMPCEELRLMTTTISVARETGGNVTSVLSQLITTIRERKKLLDKMMTLTLQGRIQAYLMSLLPVLFALFVRSFNPDYFELMFHDPVGLRMLFIAVGFWLVSIVLVFRLSKVEL